MEDDSGRHSSRIGDPDAKQKPRGDPDAEQNLRLASRRPRKQKPTLLLPSVNIDLEGEGSVSADHSYERKRTEKQRKVEQQCRINKELRDQLLLQNAQMAAKDAIISGQKSTIARERAGLEAREAVVREQEEALAKEKADMEAKEDMVKKQLEAIAKVKVRQGASEVVSRKSLEAIDGSHEAVIKKQEAKISELRCQLGIERAMSRDMAAERDRLRAEMEKLRGAGGAGVPRAGEAPGIGNL